MGRRPRRTVAPRSPLVPWLARFNSVLEGLHALSARTAAEGKPIRVGDLRRYANMERVPGAPIAAVLEAATDGEAAAGAWFAEAPEPDHAAALPDLAAKHRRRDPASRTIAGVSVRYVMVPSFPDGELRRVPDPDSVAELLRRL